MKIETVSALSRLAVAADAQPALGRIKLPPTNWPRSGMRCDVLGYDPALVLAPKDRVIEATARRRPRRPRRVKTMERIVFAAKPGLCLGIKLSSVHAAASSHHL